MVLAASRSVQQARSFLDEFRIFAMRGTVIDLAVGVAIGTAFGKIVTSLVDQVIMPPIGMLVGHVDFENLQWVLKPADPGDPGSKVAIRYGAFLDTLIQFLLIAFVVFLIVRAVNRVRERHGAEPDPAPATPTEVLLAEIRDELKTQQK